MNQHMQRASSVSGPEQVLQTGYLFLKQQRRVMIGSGSLPFANRAREGEWHHTFLASRCSVMIFRGSLIHGRHFFNDSFLAQVLGGGYKS